MAASIKAHSVSAAEDIGAVASVIVPRVSVAKRSEAAASSVVAILAGRIRASVRHGSQVQATASYNKRLVPTRGNPRAAQAQRWASE